MIPAQEFDSPIFRMSYETIYADYAVWNDNDPQRGRAEAIEEVVDILSDRAREKGYRLLERSADWQEKLWRNPNQGDWQNSQCVAFLAELISETS